MGAKSMRKVLAVLVALAVMMTSGISVFAATESSQNGSTTAKSVTVSVSGSTIKVSNSTGTIKYKVAGSKKWKTSKTSSIKKLKAGKKYLIKVNGKTYKRFIRKGAVKQTSVKGTNVTVKASKKKGSTSYLYQAVNTATGQIVKVKSKKLSYKLTLSSGTWKVTVTPYSGSYVGQKSKAKTVTID